MKIAPLAEDPDDLASVSDELIEVPRGGTISDMTELRSKLLDKIYTAYESANAFILKNRIWGLY